MEEENLVDITEPLSRQWKFLLWFLFPMTGDLSNIVSTFLRFGAVSKNQKVGARYAESR